MGKIEIGVDTVMGLEVVELPIKNDTASLHKPERGSIILKARPGDRPLNRIGPALHSQYT